jgi:hypothetical protein
VKFFVVTEALNILDVFKIQKRFLNTSLTEILTLFAKKSFLFLKLCSDDWLGGEWGLCQPVPKGMVDLRFYTKRMSSTIDRRGVKRGLKPECVPPSGTHSFIRFPTPRMQDILFAPG